jgi:hypothetical protein
MLEKNKMKKKFFSLLSMLLVAAFLTSPASAGPGIKLSGVQFSLGSLIAKGYASGLGNQDVTVVLDASGIPVVTCTNQGGNEAPGRNPSRVSAVGDQFLPGSDPLRKNGRSPFLTETDDPETLPGDVAGCPNANWTGHIDFILWTDATVSVYDTATGVLQTSQKYTCTTTRFPASVICTRVP